ncbi:glycosyltransferase family 39 protein [Natrinema salinisoli]|uniref:glycosyltransferase family 39 protein n=1 Tax=Natrinema salinisoli TaxID=2878535 RepID=UPI001CF06057|nr:glycosyltransferase family 39 protein [Natrinema salinisoli]
MSKNQQQLKLDALIVTTARMLVASYLAIGVLKWVGGIQPKIYLNIRLFFLVTFIAGLAGVFIHYYSSLQILWKERERLLLGALPIANTDILTYIARNLLILLIISYLLSLKYSILFYINIPLLYGVTVLSVAVTLALRGDRTAKRVTKGGGLVLGTLLLLNPLFDSLTFVAQPGIAVLAVVFVGLNIWDRQYYSERSNLTEQQNQQTWHFVCLSLLTGLAAAVFFYRLGKISFIGDEFQTISAAAGYYHTGEFYLWDWIASEPTPVLYDRAWPHTVFIAGSYVVFGISEWAARVPSAIAGVFSVLLTYYVVAYFTERQWIALLTSASLFLYPSVTFYFRWARMYSLVIPLFLLLIYLSHRIMTGENTIDFRKKPINDFVNTWLNFDIKLAVLTLPVLYLGYSVHINTLFVLPAAYLFVLYKTITTQERKYLLAASGGMLGLCVVSLIVTFTDRLAFLPYYLSYFGRENIIYFNYLLRFPFGRSLGVVFVLFGLFSIHVTRDEPVRSKLMYLYITCSFSLIFLMYVADRYASFAYIVHIVPLALILLIFGTHEFISIFDSPLIRYVLVGLLVLNLASPLAPGPESDTLWDLYTDDDEEYSAAYETIETNYDASEEAIFGQYLRGYYLQDVNDNATVVDMESHQQYSPTQFYRDLLQYGSGWITWETRKSYHIDPAIRNYISRHFEKYHGEGIDETSVEVYYFNQSMINKTELNTRRSISPLVAPDSIDVHTAYTDYSVEELDAVSNFGHGRLSCEGAIRNQCLQASL